MMLKAISSVLAGLAFYFLLPGYLDTPVSTTTWPGLSVLVVMVCFFLAGYLCRKAGRPRYWPFIPRGD